MSVRRVDGAALLGASPKSTLVVIGNFDGVHRGHQAVLASAVAEARSLGLAPVVLTFDPHPVVVLRGQAPSVLTTMDRRVALLGRVAEGLTVVVQPFTRELSELEPRAFVERLLLRELGAAAVVVGENFCFGRGRRGGVATLRDLAAELGFSARAQALEGDALGSYSSSRVRGAIACGDMAEAERLLGRPHSVAGRVERGDGRGQGLGFPTANLGGVLEVLPPHGVYACLVDRVTPAGAARLGLGVANLGVRPTVGAGPSLEVHVLDFAGDLYGAGLRLHLTARLRPEQRFDGLDALTRQIEKDVARARELLAGRVPDPAAGGAWS